MEPQMFVKWIHILSSTILFGTGIGIAFFMLMAHRTRDPKVVASVAGIVVLADFIFTATAGVVQPVTGFILMSLMELSFAPWIVAALSLFVFVGACWAQLEAMRLHFLGLGGSQTDLTGAYQSKFIFLERDGIFTADSLNGASYLALIRTGDGRLAPPGSVSPPQQ